MKIKEYLETNNINVDIFADEIGTKRNSVYRFMRGEEPSNKIIKRIVIVTKGEILPNDLFNIKELLNQN